MQTIEKQKQKNGDGRNPHGGRGFEFLVKTEVYLARSGNPAALLE